MMNNAFTKYKGLLLFIVLSTLFSTHALAQPKGAVCIINADQKIVVVDEILTGRVSLPAGTIGENELPQEAAQREAWEETGLVVTVGKELGRNQKAVFFQCVSDSEIIAFQNQSRFGGHVLPNWFAPHYGIEVSSARLMDPMELNAVDYRYPEALTLVQELFAQSVPQSVSYVNNLFDAAPSYNQVELHWIVQLQSWVSNLDSTLSLVIDSLLLTGLVFTSSWWLLLLLPVCYGYFQRNFTLKLLFTLIVTTLLVQVGQLGFTQPRPYVYLPLLERGGVEIGFGLPNLAVALWAVVITMLLKRLNLWNWNKGALVSGATLGWLAIALVYSGNAFIIDCLAGLILGWLCAWHMTRLDKQIGVGSDQLFQQKGVWLLATGASGLLLLWWQTPSLIALALASTVILGLIILGRLPLRVSMRSTVMLILLLIAASFTLIGIHTLVESSNLYALLVEVIRWPLLLMVSACYLAVNKTKA